MPDRERRNVADDRIERYVSSRSLTSTLRLASSANLKIFYFPAGFYRSDQPARLLAPSGPRLGCLRVAIFRKDSGVFTPCLSICAIGWRSTLIPSLNDVPAAIENSQTPLKLALFRRDPQGQYLADLFVERPEVIERHRLQIDLLHRIMRPCIGDFDLVRLMSYNEVSRSASGSPRGTVRIWAVVAF